MEEEKTASNEIRKPVFKIHSRQKGFLQTRALALQPEPRVSGDSRTLQKPAWGNFDLDECQAMKQQ